MASKRRRDRRAAQFAKSPASMRGQLTELGPGSMGPGNFAGQAPTGPAALQGSRADALVPTGQQSRYNQAAGATPPQSISDVDLSQNIWSPFQPVVPFGPPSTLYPRTFDYPVGFNLDFTGRGRMSFLKMLQVLSRSWGILRAVIETRKDQLMRIPWGVQLKDKPKAKSPRLDELREFFRRPDRENTFNRWMRMILEDAFVTDTANYYVWKDRGGKPFAAMPIAGETIKPLIDDAGRKPIYPNPCYQQIIKGLPWQNLDAHEFVYAPMRPTPQEPHYGYSPVQQIYTEVLQGIKKMLYKLEYWDSGSIPQLMVNVPSAWTPEQLAAFQAHFDILMAGNTAYKPRVRFMPSESKPFDLKNANGELLKTEEDEWVTRLVCYAFSVSPQPFVRQMNRATAESAMQEAEEEGLHPTMAWIKDDLLDPLIQSPDLGFGYDDCEFVWLPEPEVDAQKQMAVITGYVKDGIMTPDEGREQLNLAPLPEGAGAEAVVLTPNGPVPFKETLESNRQKAQAVPDELDRQGEMHDVRMDQMQNPPEPRGGPPARAEKGAGVVTPRPFQRTCGHVHGSAGTAGATWLGKGGADQLRDERGRWAAGGGGASELTDREQRSLDAYKESSLALNDYLRGDKSGGSAGDMPEVRVALDGLIARSKFSEDRVLYRGSNYVDYKGTFRDKGFVSTTSDPRIAASFVDKDEPHPRVLAIHVGSGQSGYEYQDDPQREVVLGRGSKFKTIGFDRAGVGGVSVHHVRLL